MILADTSIWIDHFRKTDKRLVELIRSEALLTHPFVIGELAMGSLANRGQVLKELSRLPSLPAARHDEVLRLVEIDSLHGIGIGWTDAHLLCSVRLRPGSSLLTRDRRLEAAAHRLIVGA